MFCFQCQETAFNKGCTIKGVCGKEPQTAALMDLLLYTSRGIAIIQKALRTKGLSDPAVSRFLLDALFCTITNANFDDEALKPGLQRLFLQRKN
jgi:hydroxylamine reductase